MSRTTIVHYRSGSALRCSNDCICQNGIWLMPCTDPMCNIPIGYLKGNKSPNYPMPTTMADTVISQDHVVIYRAHMVGCHVSEKYWLPEIPLT